MSSSGSSTVTFALPASSPPLSMWSWVLGEVAREEVDRGWLVANQCGGIAIGRCKWG
jgi:hypothetical protein